MLYAEPHQVVPEFAEAANRKMYKKRSASVYLPDHQATRFRAALLAPYRLPSVPCRRPSKAFLMLL